jgi:hypothetical protein
MKNWHKILIAVLSAGAAATAIFVKNPQSKETAEKIEETVGKVLGEVAENRP